LSRRGGSPTPALELQDDAARAVWFDAYARTCLERDLQALAAITALPDFRRTMQATALRLGQVLNQTDLARDVAVPQPTVHRWLDLLEASYLIVRVPAFATHRTQRLIKSPKPVWSDGGLALRLSGSDEATGAHLENLVLHDLLAWRDGRSRALRSAAPRRRAHRVAHRRRAGRAVVAGDLKRVWRCGSTWRGELPRRGRDG